MTGFFNRLGFHNAETTPTIAAAPLAGKSLDDIYSTFTSRDDREFPHWPNEEIQILYTGGSGISLLKRAEKFANALAAAGAFDSPKWKGLDYGCGWGRIASYLLTKGSAGQLDLCDAWEKSLGLINDGGFQNKVYKVSNFLLNGELPEAHYDFIYAMSVFTHLNRESFEWNIGRLIESLKPGAKLFFTVRHDSYIKTQIEAKRVGGGQQLDQDGFWHQTLQGTGNYGNTAVNHAYLERLCASFGGTRYLGCVESEQHLYELIRPMG